MKPKSKSLKKSDRGFDANTFWRHYVATVDSEHEWDEERPAQGRGSNRLFLFLLLFHVFLIGSVVLYNLVSERPKPVFVDNSAPQKSTKAPSTDPLSNGAYVMTANKRADTVEHRVAEGDSLKSIAAASGATQEEIAKMNHIDVNTQLAVGSVLRVPTPKAKAAPAAIPIGAQPSRINEKLLTVQPTTAPSTSQMFAAIEPAPSPKKTETVAIKLTEEKPRSRVEDSLPSAPKPKVTAKIEESPPAPAKPKVTAKVEESPPPAIKPKVTEKVQETPPAAKPKPTEAKALAKTEAPAKSKPTEAAKPATAKPAVAVTTHKVKAKETFYSISRKYGVKLDDLMRLNSGTNPNKLREGMVVKVPGKS
jgi:LysM repeat protein